MPKPRLATCSLTGCFGCHLSLLDIDERLNASNVQAFLLGIRGYEFEFNRGADGWVRR
jgi:hypothetical protein